MVFEVLGEPKGKARPRFTRAGHTYTPADTIAYETEVVWAYREKYGTMCFIKGVPLRLEVTAYFKVPKNATKAKRADMLSGKIRPTKKPDCDNVLKIIADALNGVAYHDDAQIVELNFEKLYSDIPRVVIEIEEAKG